jgi:hypothetical protein
MVEADREIFINLDEFATEHDVDGSMIHIVLEDEQVESKDETQALSQSALIMFAKTEELNGRKMQGETLYIDDVGYTVQTWLDEMGVTKVTLSLPESW